MRVVAFDAIAHRRWMNRTFYIVGIFIRVAGQTKSMRSGRDQLYAGDVFISANLVAGGAAHCNGRMHRLPLGLILMAGETCGRISFRIKRYWMLGG